MDIQPASPEAAAALASEMGAPTPDAPVAPPRDRERDNKLASQVMANYTKRRTFRRPFEGNWFVNGAMLRGQQHVEYSDVLGQLVTPDAPSYAVRISINKIRPKHKARMAKFFKNRPKPVVIAASTDYQDLMDARASEIALRYQWDRLNLEGAYKAAKQWGAVCHKAYWWFGYDDTVVGRVREIDPLTLKPYESPAPLGDVVIEVGNAWEVLVEDPAISDIGKQPGIMRVRSISRKEAERRYPALAEDDNMGSGSDGSGGDTPQRSADRLASLKPDYSSVSTPPQRTDQVLLLEDFTAPCAEYPKGRKLVVCDGILVKEHDELPFGFYDSPTNPYPCSEFIDTETAGQAYGTTFIEQLIDLQRTYNDTIAKVVENIRAVSRPKVVVYRQHQLADGAYTSSAGEVLELNYIPGLPPPIILQAANVAGDCWNLIQLLEREFDSVSQVYPSSEGRAAGAESGYQTSLLQEATDSVHAPEIRNDEMTIQDAAWKIRRIMKRNYDVPRLIAIGGENSAPEMLEFSQSQINDAAEVRIQIGSMLPDLKAAKAQVLLNFYEKGLLGDPNDPLVKRRALSLMEMGGYEVLHEEERLDEAEAARENQAITDGQPVEPAKFFQRHQLHIWKHEARMKQPSFASLAPDRQMVHVAHLITHYDFINPMFAMGLRQQYGLTALPIATPPPPPVPPGMGAMAPGAPAPPPSGPPAPPSPQTPALPQV